MKGVDPYDVLEMGRNDGWIRKSFACRYVCAINSRPVNGECCLSVIASHGKIEGTVDHMHVQPNLHLHMGSIGDKAAAARLIGTA